MKKQANFVVSNTYLSSFYAVLDNIKQIIDNDKTQNIILVVPDKFSLNAEQLVFEYLKTDSLFNVWLTTLSRLEKKVLKDVESYYNVLTKQSGTMLVGKIILQNADKLVTYKKVQNRFDFAENMFNTINLLKSSNIKPSELVENIDSSNFGGKIKDIYLIYSEYEKALGSDKLDTVTRYELFDDVCKNNDYIKNSHIFFGMFDSFTNAQISLLTNLSQVAKSLTIGCCYNVLQNNKNIYDNVVYQRLVNAFNGCNIKTNITFKNAQLKSLQNFMLNNMFAFGNNTTFETDKVKVLECENIEQELRYIASKIKYLVLEKNYTFDDISVAVNGLDTYSLQLQKVFDEYDLPYFIDQTKTLADHYLIKTLVAIFDFITDKNFTVDAISISQSPLFNIDQQKQATFANFCYKYNIMADEFFKTFSFDNSEDCQIAEDVRKQVFDSIFQLKTSLQQCKYFYEINDNITYFLDSLSIVEKIDNYSQQQDIVQQSIDSQVYDKLIKLLYEANNILSNEEVTTDFAFSVLKSGFASVKLSTVPIKCDSVFVGDCSESTFITKKALFIAGATQSRMPIASVDAGTITDDEIQQFKAKSQITPSIKEINKREKFKLFNLILKFTDILEFTYSLQINGELQFASDFVTKLCDILTYNGKRLQADIYNQIPLLVFDNNEQMLVEYFVGTSQNAVRLAKSNRKENQTIKYMLNQNLKQTVAEQEKLYLQNTDRFKIENSKKVLFPNGNTKVSQVEKYFNCPFKQFVDYGIRPQVHQKYELKALDVGNILHKVAELFIQHCIKTKFAEFDIVAVTEKLFNKVINTEQYKNIKDKAYEIKNLRNETIRFCKAIKHQIDNSDYKPQKPEFKFENYLLPSGITLKGFVDRVDICDVTNSFRIIDYKTGKDEFSYKDTYYGLKIQLLVYLKCLQDILNKNPVGASYMPVKNTFNNIDDTEYKPYQLDGVLLNDEGVILRSDKQLIDNNKSDIINVVFTKERNIYSNNLRYLLSSKEMQDILNYSITILNGAVNEMLNGYIQPKPYQKNQKNSCEYCEYKAMCRYDILKQGYRTVNGKKEKNSFTKEQDE